MQIEWTAAELRAIMSRAVELWMARASGQVSTDFAAFTALAVQLNLEKQDCIPIEVQKAVARLAVSAHRGVAAEKERDALRAEVDRLNELRRIEHEAHGRATAAERQRAVDAEAELQKQSAAYESWQTLFNELRVLLDQQPEEDTLSAVQRVVKERDAFTQRASSLEARLRDYHGEVDGEDVAHSDEHDGVSGIVAWVKKCKARLAETHAGIFDSSLRCVSEGCEIFYLDPEELEALQDERDELRVELAHDKQRAKTAESRLAAIREAWKRDPWQPLGTVSAQLDDGSTGCPVPAWGDATNPSHGAPPTTPTQPAEKCPACDGPGADCSQCHGSGVKQPSRFLGAHPIPTKPASYTEGVEAMRAACQKAVRQCLAKHGSIPSGMLRNLLMDAIKRIIP